MAGQYIEHGNGRPWHKRVLVPFWLIQVVFMAIQIAASAYGISQSSGNNISATTVDNGDGTRTVTATINGQTSSTTISNNGTAVSGNKSNSSVSISSSGVITALYSIILAIASISLLFTLIEIISFARHHLTPTKYFVFNLLKFLAWTVLFCVGIANAVLYGTYVLSLVVNIVVECTFLAALIYGSVIFHRYRKQRALGHNPGAKQQPVDYTHVQPGYQPYSSHA